VSGLSPKCRFVDDIKGSFLSRCLAIGIDTALVYNFLKRERYCEANKPV